VKEIGGNSEGGKKRVQRKSKKRQIGLTLTVVSVFSVTWSNKNLTGGGRALQGRKKSPKENEGRVT